MPDMLKITFFVGSFSIKFDIKYETLEFNSIEKISQLITNNSILLKNRFQIQIIALL